MRFHLGKPVATLEAALRLAIVEETPAVVLDKRSAPAPAPSIADTVADEPPVGQRLLSMLAEVLPSGELEALAARVQRHGDKFDGADPNGPPKRIAETLTAGLTSPLQLYPALATSQQAPAVGAARYFCSEADEMPDFSTPSGLHDDLAVFNWVVRQIRRGELVIHD